MLLMAAGWLRSVGVGEDLNSAGSALGTRRFVDTVVKT